MNARIPLLSLAPHFSLNHVHRVVLLNEELLHFVSDVCPNRHAHRPPRSLPECLIGHVRDLGNFPGRLDVADVLSMCE